jgi:cytochrome c556
LQSKNFRKTQEYKLFKFAASLALGVAAANMAIPASAQFAKPDDAVKYRQSVMTVMSTHFGRIGAMANGKAPYDAKAAIDNAQIVAAMAKLPWPGFSAESEKSSLENRAKPEVWSNSAKFKEDGDHLVSETGKLLAAAQTNSLDNLKTAFASTGKACKSCHDDFRKDKK